MSNPDTGLAEAVERLEWVAGTKTVLGNKAGVIVELGCLRTLLDSWRQRGERIGWFEKAGGAAMGTRIHSALADVARLTAEVELLRGAAEKHYALAEDRLILLDHAEAALAAANERAEKAYERGFADAREMAAQVANECDPPPHALADVEGIEADIRALRPKGASDAAQECSACKHPRHAFQNCPGPCLCPAGDAAQDEPKVR